MNALKNSKAKKALILKYIVKHTLLKEKWTEAMWGITFFGSWWFFGMTMLFFSYINMTLFKFVLMGGILGEAIGNPIKAIFFKDRPKKKKYHNLLTKIDASAFPSLHTFRGIFLGLFYAMFFQPIVLQVFCVLFGCVVGYSRIRLKKHDWKDVLGGAVLGIFVFYFVLFYFSAF